MGTLFRSVITCVLLLLTPMLVRAQALPPALAERFSHAIADLRAGQLDAAETSFRGILRDGGDVAPVHHNLAIVLQQRGRHEQALVEFDAASRIDPSYGPARLLASTSLVALGRYRDARAALEHAVRLMPREMNASLQLAAVCQRLADRMCVANAYRHVTQLAPDDAEYAYRLGSAQLEVSESAYERLRQKHPTSARVQQALGREYLQQNRPDQALDAFQRALEADPTVPDLHLALARIHLDAGRVNEASREISRELAMVPFGKDALELKARIDRIAQPPATSPASSTDAVAPPAALTSAGIASIDAAITERRWADAEHGLADAIEREPTRRDLLVLIARVFVLDGKPLNAAVALKKADALAPLDRELRFALVLAYVRLGRADWAEPELERLVQEDPKSPEYRYWLGRLAYDGGKYAQAIARFQESLALDSHFMRAHDNLGLCYEQLDDPERAIEHYREAVRLNRESRTRSPWPPTNLAVLLRQRGGQEEAGVLLREAIQYDGGFAKGHYELGVLLDEQGKTAESVQELERSVVLDGTYPEPHYVLARIYRRQGDAARADEALATFKRLRAAREQGAK